MAAIPKMIGKMCPSCGARFDGVVKFSNGSEVDITKPDAVIPPMESTDQNIESGDGEA